MIANENQYQVTLDWIKRFEQDLKEAEAERDNRPEGESPLFYDARVNGLASQLETLRLERDDWERRVKLIQVAREEAIHFENLYNIKLEASTAFQFFPPAPLVFKGSFMTVAEVDKIEQAARDTFESLGMRVRVLRDNTILDRENIMWMIDLIIDFKEAV